MSKVNILLAMPSLKTSMFSHSVVLMAKDHEGNPIGFITNTVTGMSLKRLIKILKLNINIDTGLQILFGGPVEQDFFWVMHDSKWKYNSTITLNQQFALSSAHEVFQDMAAGVPITIHQAGIGFSGWDIKQLEQEIQEGSWWQLNCDVDLILNTNHEQQWQKIVQGMGINPANFIDNTDPSAPIIH